jgi:hypothetical protein
MRDNVVNFTPPHFDFIYHGRTLSSVDITFAFIIVFNLYSPCSQIVVLRTIIVVFY